MVPNGWYSVDGFQWIECTFVAQRHSTQWDEIANQAPHNSKIRPIKAAASSLLFWEAIYWHLYRRANTDEYRNDNTGEYRNDNTDELIETANTDKLIRSLNADRHLSLSTNCFALIQTINLIIFAFESIRLNAFEWTPLTFHGLTAVDKLK